MYESGAHVLKLLPLLAFSGLDAHIWGMSLVVWEISANQSTRSGGEEEETSSAGDGAGWGCGYGGG